MKLGVLLAVILFASLLTRTQTAALASSTAGPSGDDADYPLSRQINTIGFTAWTALDSFPGYPDATVSPFAIWYLNQFTESGWRHADPKITVALKSLIERSGLSGAIHVNRSRVAFTQSDAAIAVRVWAASTSWTSTGDSDVRADVSLRRTFAFHNHPQVMPFFVGDGLRAVRFDSTDGLAQVFVIQGTPERLSQFRQEITEPEWERFTSRFRDTRVELDVLTLSRASYMEVQSNSSMLFGATVSPATVIQHAIFGNQSFALSPRGGDITFAATIQGKVVPPPVTRSYSNGTSVSVYHAPDSTTYAPAPRLPNERYISLLQPMIYVVVDRPTGVILLIGMHE